MPAPPMSALDQGRRICVFGDQTLHAYPLPFLTPQRAHQKHNMWGLCWAEIQDNGVFLTKQGVRPVDNLCAKCELFLFPTCMDGQPFKIAASSRLNLQHLELISPFRSI